MEQEIKELLEKDIAIDEENNKILKKMQFSSRIALTLSIIKWVVVVGSILGISLWLRPQFEALISTYSELLK